MPSKGEKQGWLVPGTLWAEASRSRSWKALEHPGGEAWECRTVAGGAAWNRWKLLDRRRNAALKFCDGPPKEH